MSEVPSLTYSKARGFAQFARVALSYLNVPFENVTVETIDDALREKLPYGQLPIFRDGDFVVAQSQTIARYIAKKYNFAGKTLQEETKVDEVISAIHSDFFTALNPATLDKEKLKNNTFPKIFGKYNNELKEKKHLVGDSYTIADLYVYVAFEYIQFRGFSEDVNATQYPQLEELKKYFESNAGVQEYLKNRPETQV
ncbi:hypothetical protein DICPUDRAFT_71962 [Dictyostelium purpureum]|uniref:Glutathione S-transferase n=1 Tax=Dictyostelium purpureum TaxID=5786 RepID=F0ZET7_DICPU|nr:uncharacterized protein DICPUDRAFT_71962 [Dictyostelium purpureum]EGC37550.1 hypothetical protein DICPUDRAFT_71962 [Dictyostelium purpureum]|eukprot:XP_003285941.1 hypothetical protein DICPUDRAFT_71962 [Dictyostelium purpureum]